MTSTVEPAPRDLTADEECTWRAVAELARAVLGGLDRELRSRSGLPLSYREVLAVLDRAPQGAARMGELATALHMSRSRLSHTVSRMEQRGWVMRGNAPNDGRGHVAVLTQAGADLLRAAEPTYVSAIRGHLLDLLTADEAKQLRHISESVLTRATQGGESPTGATHD